MADHFLTKSEITLSRCLEYGAGLALDSHAALRSIVADRVSPQAASLFAEPLLSRGNDTAPASVAWYCDLSGDGRPLADLSGSERTRVEAIISEHLRALRAVLDDPEDGPLLGAALHLGRGTDQDIWVVDGQPIIINWGMLPDGIGRDADARAAHFAATLGRYLPLNAAPPLNATDARERASARPAATAAMAAGGVAAAAGTAQATRASEPVAAPVAAAAPERRISTLAWLPLLLLLLLAGGALAWLLIPGNRIFPMADADPALSDVQSAAAVAEINASLVARRDSLRAALAGAQCRADGTLIMPDGRMIEGMLPPRPGNPDDAPGRRADASPTPMLPPASDRVIVAGADSANPLDRTTLSQQIAPRTVMVTANHADGTLSVASGFFVTSDLVVTSARVVGDPATTSLTVGNADIPAGLSARIIKASGPVEISGQDFALLQVSGANQPRFPILNAASPQTLQSVVAAGYAQDVLLQHANTPAMPRPAAQITDGTITAQAVLGTVMGSALRPVAHSAPVSPGNAGGPLVDMCGRVVGVNTFVQQGGLRDINLSLGSQDLLAFLSTTPAALDVVTQPCTPVVLRPQVTPVAVLDVPLVDAPAGLPRFNLPGNE